MMHRAAIVVCFYLLLAASSAAQIGLDLEREQQLQAATKQVNQFFRRFNGEEGPDGKRYYPSDPMYRAHAVRLAYLPQLFDKQSPISDSLKQAFIQRVTAGEHEVFLSLHEGLFLAEVQTSFVLGGQPEPVTLYLKLQKEKVGSKWVITGAFAPYYQQLFKEDTLSGSPEGPFLHPLSHELEFMNLRRAFEHPERMASYLAESYSVDHLSFLLLELKRGKAYFKTVTDVSFHSTQVPGWYFRLKQMHRAQWNSGWLIQHLARVESAHSPIKLQGYAVD